MFSLGHSSSSICTSMPSGNGLPGFVSGPVHRNMPEFPPGSVCIHSTCSTKFSYCFRFARHQSDVRSRPACRSRRPGIFRGIEVDPSGQVLAIEQVPELRNIRGPGTAGRQKKPCHQADGTESFHCGSPFETIIAANSQSVSGRGALPQWPDSSVPLTITPLAFQPNPARTSAGQ